MSREQADAVALAVDNPVVRWDPKYRVQYVEWSERNGRIVGTPLSDTFYKNCLASGAITPPLGESTAVRRSDWITGICVLCLLGCGLAFAVGAYIWRA